MYLLLGLIQCLGIQKPLEAKPCSSVNDSRNPVIHAYLADPFIYRAGDNYYLIATGSSPDGRYLPIYKSADLVDWEFVRGAVEMGPEGSWNRKNFWAPEVVKRDGHWCLYYTASRDDTPENTGNRVGLAVSDTPDGPFLDKGVVIGQPSLDGSPFRDGDGTWYLFFTTETTTRPSDPKPGQIHVARMPAPDRIGKNVRPIVDHLGWQEGPFMIQRDGKYYLLYSSGGWKTPAYQVRYAVADTPTGPFSHMDEPLIQQTEDVKGPGHCMVFSDTKGNLYLSYHGWDPEFTARYPRIDPLAIKNGLLVTPAPTMPANQQGNH